MTNGLVESEFAGIVANFLRDNNERIGIEPSRIGRIYIQMCLINARLAKNPGLAKELGVEVSLRTKLGDMLIVDYVSGLVDRPSVAPILILAGDEYFRRPIGPLPAGVRVVSVKHVFEGLACKIRLGAIRPAINAEGAPPLEFSPELIHENSGDVVLLEWLLGKEPELQIDTAVLHLDEFGQRQPADPAEIARRQS